MSDANQPSDYAKSLQSFCDAVLENNAQVAVYNNNYRGVHLRALQNIYLTVQHYLGEDIFSALAVVYVQHYPPTRWDLNIYGADFPELLAAQTNSDKANMFDWVLLAGVARIEYAISRAYYGYMPEYEQLPPGTRTEFIHKLQTRHPYVKITNDLDVNQTIKIWCADSKVYIQNHP